MCVCALSKCVSACVFVCVGGHVLLSVCMCVWLGACVTVRVYLQECMRHPLRSLIGLSFHFLFA